jgi:hypothetical protein
MRRVSTIVGTILIMTAMFWAGIRGPTRPRTTADANDVRRTTTAADFRIADSPTADSGVRDAVARLDGLFQSAQSGDAAGYLAAFGGPLRARLEREAGESGQDVFAGNLRRAASARKGHAIFAPEPDGGRSGALRIVVESAFADRIERQTYHLERGPAGWLVTEVETARDRIPRNKLGSLATYHEPEGVPVPIAAAGQNEPRNDSDENQ